MIVLATSGMPPALAVLSTGDVWLDRGTVLVALHSGSAAAERLGGAFSVLVPTTTRALRLEVVEATAHGRGSLVVLNGRLSEIRPTGEPPWLLEMRFAAPDQTEVDAFVRYWHAVRGWLQAGAVDAAPPVPAGRYASMADEIATQEVVFDVQC